MAGRPRLSLLWTYALTFSAVVSLLLLAGGAMQALLIWRGSLASVTQAQRAHANHAAAEIGGFITRTQQALQPIAAKFGHPDARFGRAEPAAGVEGALRIEMAVLLRQRPEIGALRWIGADGVERLALRRIGLDDADRGRDWRHDPVWQQARKRGSAIGEVELRAGSEPHVSVAAAAGSVLLAELNLTFVRDVVARVSPEAGVAYVVDRHGGLIAHPRIDRVLARADVASLPQVRAALDLSSSLVPGSEAARDLDGQPVLASSAAVPGLDWRVMVEEPRAQAMAPVFEALRQSLALVLLGLAAAVCAGLVLARRIVQPILRVESKARELADGRFDAPIEPAGAAELQSLATQFNRMAERLKATLADQERLISERTRELAESNDAKTRFIDVASHDLRQPVHAIGLLAQQLGDVSADGEAGRVAERISEATQGLSRLVDALLDLSQLDRGTIRVESRPIPLRPLVARVVARHAPEAEAKGLALAAVPTSAWVHADPLQLERVLGNLVSNAVRYTSDGRVLVGCRRRRANAASGGQPWIELIVADTGCGIAAEELSLVTREFWRAGRGARGGDGLGLGLAIVERLAGLMGHRFWLSSKLGRGTLAHLLLPGAPASVGSTADAPPDQAETTAGNLAGREVLVVDDDALTRDALRDLMARWGCRVRTAGSVASALEQAAGAEIVLCDLDLREGVDGVELVQRLRSRYGPELRCAFVSGTASPEILARARATGLLLATKPVAPARMRALLEHLACVQS